MPNPSLFDIISPIMIGPSSSHTAGAVRLGLLARNIFGETPQEVTFKLYNSYASTGKGHGTDKGLLAGILGLKVDDIRIRHIFDSKLSQSLKYNFEFIQDFSRHPNAVDMYLKGSHEMFISGDSVGAGEIVITRINSFNVSLTGEYNTLILVYRDKPGMISAVTSMFQSKKLNIASLDCDRNARGKEASMVICVDGDLDDGVVNSIREMKDVYFVTYVRKLEK